MIPRPELPSRRAVALALIVRSDITHTLTNAGREPTLTDRLHAGELDADWRTHQSQETTR